MTMCERAINAMKRQPERMVWSLSELRVEAGIKLRSQYRLSLQLMDRPEVEHIGRNHFRLVDATQ